MKISKGLKRTLAAALAVVLVGGMTNMSAFAQEIEETGAELPAASEESEVKVTGARETLDCKDAARNMNLEFFNEVEGAGSWLERMEFPEYAAILYNELANGFDGAFVEDNAFSEENAARITYSSGKEAIFNGFEVLNVALAAEMTDEEWSTIQENLSNAYVAFQRDYAGVFWLGDSPKVIRTCSEQMAEDGTKIYDYTVYFVLKTHDRNYDIRKDTYESAEAVWAGVSERDQAVQEVIAGVTDSDAAKVVTYFNKNLDAVAKSMGGGADNAARAMKLLCNSAGVPCILAAGAGGALESYVYIDGVWYDPDEVKVQEEEKPAETEKKEEEKKAEEKKEEEKKAEEKKDTTPVALPAVRSVEQVEVAPTMNSTARAASAEVVEADKFYVLQEGNVKKEANQDEVIGAILSPINDADLVFGKTWGQIVGPKIKSAQGTVCFEYKGAEVKDLVFSLRDGYSGVYPTAGPKKDFQLLYKGNCEVGGNSIRIEGTLTGYQDIKCKSLPVGTNSLRFDRIYKGTTADDFTPMQDPGITWQKNIGGANGIVEVRAIPMVDDGIFEDKGSDGTSGTVQVKLQFLTNTSSLKDNAMNYTLGDNDCPLEAREGERVLTDRIRWSSVPQLLVSGGLDIEIDNSYPLVYTGNNLTPPIKVYDKDHDELRINTDYVVTYSNNRDATEDTDTPANIHISPRGQKYTWDDKEEFNATFKILKAPKDNIELEQEQVTKYGKNAQVDLSRYMETGARIIKADIMEAKDAAGNNINGDVLFSVAPKDANVTGGGVIEYTITDNEALIGATANIMVSVGSAKNYNDYKISFPIKVANKSEQADFKFEYEKIKMVKGEEREIRLKTVEGSSLKISLDENNASVVDMDYDENGTVILRAASPGRTTITAEAGQTTDYRKKTITCDIEVVPKGHTITYTRKNPETGDKIKIDIVPEDKNNIISYSSQFSSGGKEYMLELEEGVSTKYKEVGMDPEEIELSLIEELLDFKPTTQHIAVYDVNLFVKSTDGNWVWQEIKDDPDEEQGEIGFPKGGVRVRFPYPKEANMNIHKFVAAHMLTVGRQAGKIEKWDEDEDEIDKTSDEVEFTMTSLSPIAIGWEEIPSEPVNPDDPTNPNNPDDPTNPSDPTNPNNPTDPTNPNNQNSNTSTNNGTTTRTAGTTTGTGTGTGASGGTGTTTGSKVLGALTGDNAQILVYAVLLGLTAAVICGLFALRKKPKAKKSK